MKWVIIFFFIGLLFGLAADKWAWTVLIVPLFFFFISWYLEGMSGYLVIVFLASMVTLGAGIMVGHLLVFRRDDTAPSEA